MRGGALIAGVYAWSSERRRPNSEKQILIGGYPHENIKQYAVCTVCSNLGGAGRFSEVSRTRVNR
jgi:hypothetical protein